MVKCSDWKSNYLLYVVFLNNCAEVIYTILNIHEIAERTIVLVEYLTVGMKR